MAGQVKSSSRKILMLSALISYHVLATNPDCSCGYSVNSTSDKSYAVFTEIIETDFLHVSSLDHNSCWEPQAYNVTAAQGHGEYGKMATTQNIVPNPLGAESDSMGIHGGDAGLQLWVGSALVDGMVPIAEVVARNGDMTYGSFRVGMKITSTPGTCSAFFWYRNNTEEIDMEFLSSQFNSTSQPVFLVMQTPKHHAAGFNSTEPSTYAIIQLSFAPEDGFHEYRFDWTPDVVSFYADGLWIQDMFYIYADEPGHLTLNHWSNGNQKWSEGPPTSNAVTTISYVMAYFNSSDPRRQSMYNTRCPVMDENKICQIPDQMLANGRPKFLSGGMCGSHSSTPTTTTTQSKHSFQMRTSTSASTLALGTPSYSVSRSSSKLSSKASSFLRTHGFTVDVRGFLRGFAIGGPLGILAIIGA